MLNSFKRHVVWVFLDVGQPFAQTWEGKLVYRISKWLAEHVEVKE